MANVDPRPEAPQPLPGVTESFASVYAQCSPAIVRYLRRRLGDSAADDAAAEVFVRAFRQAESYEARHTTPLPWLYAIATNVIAEERRHERRRLRAMERLAAQRSSESKDPAECLGPDPRLIRALRRLAVKDRETLLLVAWGELSQKEAAVVLGVPAGTVRSRVARARTQIERALGESGTPIELRSLTGETNA